LSIWRIQILILGIWNVWAEPQAPLNDIYSKSMFKNTQSRNAKIQNLVHTFILRVEV